MTAALLCLSIEWPATYADDDDDESLRLDPIQTLSFDAPGNSFFWGNFFGVHMASDSNGAWLFVAANRADSLGLVQVYRRSDDGGPETFHLHQPPLTGLGRSLSPPLDFFGSGLVVCGKYLFVAVANDQDFEGEDPTQDPNGTPFVFAGKVYVYCFNAATDRWEGPVQELISKDPGSGKGFGGRTGAKRLAAFKFRAGDHAGGETVVLAVGEHDNWDHTVFDPNQPKLGKLHLFRSVEGGDGPFVRAHDPIVLPEVDPQVPPSYEGLSFLGDDLVAVNGDHLALYDPAGQVLLYRVGPNGVPPNADGERLPVQTLDLPPTGPCVPFDAVIAAGGDTFVVTGPCNDKVYVYRFREKKKKPLKLVQTLDPIALSWEQILGNHFFGGSQGVATNGRVLLVGSTRQDGDFENFTFIDPQFEDVQVYVRGDDDDDGFAPATTVGSPNFDRSSFYGAAIAFAGDGLVAIAQPSALRFFDPDIFEPNGLSEVYLFRLSGDGGDDADDDD